MPQDLTTTPGATLADTFVGTGQKTKDLLDYDTEWIDEA